MKPLIRPIYYDTETTGIKAGKDRLIEIAALDVERKLEFCTLVDPECPIPAESTAITSITDDMVQGAPKIGEALHRFIHFCQGNVVLVAHNNDAFDRPFLEAEFKRADLTIPSWMFFDTLKWARKYRPDLPRHSLQFLREIYGIEANQAHRALNDVYVLNEVFGRMVGDLSWTDIIALIQEARKPTHMPFGKHAGKPLKELPHSYRAWLFESGALDKEDNRLLKEALQEIS
jgi:DNA polymerase-3 subunit epsilon